MVTPSTDADSKSNIYTPYYMRRQGIMQYNNNLHRNICTQRYNGSKQ